MVRDRFRVTVRLLTVLQHWWLQYPLDGTVASSILDSRHCYRQPTLRRVFTEECFEAYVHWLSSSLSTMTICMVGAVCILRQHFMSFVISSYLLILKNWFNIRSLLKLNTRALFTSHAYQLINIHLVQPGNDIALPSAGGRFLLDEHSSEYIISSSMIVTYNYRYECTILWMWTRQDKTLKTTLKQGAGHWPQCP